MAGSTTKVRVGQAPTQFTREMFHQRFMEGFADPAFAVEAEALQRVEAIAWQAHRQGRKSPVTRRAGAGFADPSYELSSDWLATSSRLKAAQRQQATKRGPQRILVICASPRNDGTCPGEISKTYRLAQIAMRAIRRSKMVADLLDLSLVTSTYRLHIHPCKGCVSTAMPLCHWPCSCYPNHAAGQTGDWMAEIYERWVLAHGVVIVTPTHWYQATSPLKLMMDRLVCADGGNPDPTSTHGKRAEEAKALELRGWDYPKHLAGRAFGVMVHGDVAGIEGTRRALCDWLSWMGLVDSGFQTQLDRYIGYFEPYATSHAALDQDRAVQTEMRNVALAVVQAARLLRAGKLSSPDRNLERPRPK